jgi:hypothetical protein
MEIWSTAEMPGISGVDMGIGYVAAEIDQHTPCRVAMYRRYRDVYGVDARQSPT